MIHCKLAVVCVDALTLYTLTSVRIFSILFSYISWGADKENLFNNQELVWFVISGDIVKRNYMLAFIWCVIFKRPFATVFQKVLLLLFDFFKFLIQCIQSLYIHWCSALELVRIWRQLRQESFISSCWNWSKCKLQGSTILSGL